MYPDGIYDFVTANFCFDRCLDLKLYHYTDLLRKEFSRQAINPEWQNNPAFAWHVENAILILLAERVKSHLSSDVGQNNKIWQAAQILAEDEEDRYGYLLEDYLCRDVVTGNTQYNLEL